MKIPRKLHIGGHEVMVRKYPSLDGGKTRGEWRFATSQIRLSTNHTEDVVAECFLHEIAEMIRIQQNLCIGHPALTSLIETLFAAIRQNNLDFRKGK
jgi:hypothetical protein